tara:strand:- start:3265 stop:3609 length:345 start_codon:yes stop_codon:yes gene_type:complete
MPHGENQTATTSNSSLLFWIEKTNSEQQNFFVEFEGLQLRGYNIAQKITSAIFPTWREHSDVGAYNGVLIDPKYWYMGAQEEYLKENLSQQFRSYYIAHGYMANYYEPLEENSS